MMSQREQGLASGFTVLMALLALGACSYGQGQERPNEQTSEAQPVASLEDNAVVLQDIQPGIVVILRIQDQNVEIEDVQVRSFPELPQREFGPGMIRVTGLIGGSEVASVVVPDEELNVQEGVGLVRLEERTLAVALRLERRIDQIAVQLGPDTAPQEFDVSQIFDDYCAERPTAALCRSR